MTDKMTKRLYLAGFDVFRTDAETHGAWLKEQCRRFGFEGLFPLDQACPAGLGARQAAQWIYDANVALIRRADMLVANLNNFRGREPDSGTCFEIGFAVALGLPTWGYLSCADDLVQQIPHARSAAGHCLDADGYLVEDFGLSRNLMLSCSSAIVCGDLQDCLAQIAAAEWESS